MTDVTALEAHARLAALPRIVHRKPEIVVDRAAAAEKAARTRGRAITVAKPTPARSQPMTRRTRSAQPAPSAEAKPRKKRASFVILNARPNRWGFSRGDVLEVLDDGGSWAGSRGEYAGAASSTYVYLRVAGVKASVRADRVRKVAR